MNAFAPTLAPPNPDHVPTRELEKGTFQTTIRVPVDDYVYCKQDQYGLPHQTVDADGNTIVSVIDEVEVEYPDRGEHLIARMTIRAFKNQTVEATPVRLAQETDPIRTVSPSNLQQSLIWNKVHSTVLQQMYRNYLYNTTRSRATDTAVTSYRYSAYNDDTDITSSTIQYTQTPTNTRSTYIRPYITNSGIRTNYIRWEPAYDTGWGEHIRYWAGEENAKVVDPLAKLREIIRSRQAPAIIVHSTALRSTTDIREIRARQTLRRLIGETAYQRYAVRGFITYRGVETQRTYQIFPGHGKTKVWKDGKQIEELCVVLSGDFPPTDSVVMRLLLIQESEERFKKIANVFPAYAPNLNRQVEAAKPSDNLPQLFHSLKLAQRATMPRLVA